MEKLNRNMIGNLHTPVLLNLIRSNGSTDQLDEPVTKSSWVIHWTVQAIRSLTCQWTDGSTNKPNELADFSRNPDHMLL